MPNFLVTGGAGFIGSNLVHSLVERDHSVRIIDDFSTGRRENLMDVRDKVHIFEGNVCDHELLAKAANDVDYCLHQAAIPSVLRSVEDPVASNRANVEGTLQVFLAARDAGVRRVVFASSSSVYGDNEILPAHEDLPVAPISPYGVSKAADELYAKAFSNLYGIELVGLRYFNVFGPRQNPRSQYAAVIPIFISRMMAGERPTIDGDGNQLRDFSYIDNIVQANLKACEAPGNISGVYNIACGESTSIVDLVVLLNDILGTDIRPVFGPPRAGDIRQSCADISRARDVLGYEPTIGIREGLRRTVEWIREAR